jgi:aryl-alcohol dehydrogenase-like predicted oxidoreductase
MPLRRIGSTDLWVSPLGLGTVKFGRNQQVKYPEPFALPDDKTIRSLLNIARDLDINLLDTAPAYGYSEERLGKLLKQDRKHWIIVSKTGEEFIDGESQFNFSREHTRLSVERSLKRLGTDYLDMVLVHSDGDDLKIIQQTEVIATLAELKKAGWIRSFGVSTKTIEGGKLAIDVSDAAMVSFNPDYQDEFAVLDYAQQQQKGILIKKALASGHLDKNCSLEERFEFIFSQAAVSSIIIGTLNKEHLTQNVAAVKNVLNID